MEQYGYQIVCYVVGSFVALLFAIYAFAYGWWWTKKQERNQGTEDFVTARGSQSMLRIGWSFYAGAVGSWAIVTPSQVSLCTACSAAVLIGGSLVHWQQGSSSSSTSSSAVDANTQPVGVGLRRPFCVSQVLNGVNSGGT
jgi:hypothetical protein